jgi:serine/threonine protein kinase
MPDVVRTVGRYEIVREIGRGGMAIVYLARQSELDRHVALKELAAFHQSDPAFAQRFVRESRLAASLTHPNVVTVHDYFEHDGAPYIAMEVLERGSLRPYVKQLTLAQTAGVLEGLLAGLAHAETRGVVHRDLKPENLMLTDDGRVKIADFGIAKASSGMTSNAMLTATGMTVGTPTYMAPEQAMALDIGPWTDLYSVGCMAYEMLGGQPPFADGGAPMAILMRHVNEPPRPLSAVAPSVDPALSDWVGKLLVKDPKQRTTSAVDAWDELEEIVIAQLGPRWRRDARIVDRGLTVDTPRPLTPAPFQSTHTPTPTPGAHPSAPQPGPETPEPNESGFESFHIGARASAMPPEQAPAAEAPVAEPESAEPVAPVAEPEPAEPTGDRSRFFTFRGSTRRAPPEPPAAAPEPEPPVPEPSLAPVPVAPPVAAPMDEVVAPTVAPQRPLVSEPQPVAAAAGRSSATLRRRQAGLVAGVVGLCAVVGFLLAPSKSEKQAPTAPQAAVTQAFALSHPPQLRPVGAPAQLGLADPIALARPDRPDQVIAAGRLDASGPTLLPDGLTGSLDRVPRPARVRLGELEALRYDDLRPSGGSGALRVYAVPTSAGVLGVICAAPQAALRALAGDCESVAQTLKLRGGARGFPVGPSAAYAAALGKALRPLGAQRKAARAQLTAARTPAGQGSSARLVGEAYRRAAAALRDLKLSPYDQSANATLVAALDRSQRAYQGLASAATGSDRAAYAEARRAIASAERAVATAVTNLKTLGYEVAG